MSTRAPQSVLAIDPGLVTGWARLFRIGNDAPEITVGHCVTWEDFGVLFARENNLTDGTAIVEQPFVGRSTDPIVFQVYGAAHCVAQCEGWRFIPQRAHVPSFMCANSEYNLKNRMGGIIHERDAWCHLAYYARQWWDINTLLANTNWKGNK